jgi:hypothetical protein
MSVIKRRSLVPASYHFIIERPGIWSALRTDLGISL